MLGFKKFKICLLCNILLKVFQSMCETGISGFHFQSFCNIKSKEIWQGVHAATNLRYLLDTVMCRAQGLVPSQCGHITHKAKYLKTIVKHYSYGLDVSTGDGDIFGAQNLMETLDNMKVREWLRKAQHQINMLLTSNQYYTINITKFRSNKSRFEFSFTAGTICISAWKTETQNFVSK